MSSAEIEAGLAAEPEDELVQVEIDGAKRKKKTGKGRIIAHRHLRDRDRGRVRVRAAEDRRLRGRLGSGQGRSRGSGSSPCSARFSSTPPPTAHRGWPRCRGSPTCTRRGCRLRPLRMSMVAPGGAAVGMASSFAMLKAWGFKGRPVGLAVVVTGIWNQLIDPRPADPRVRRPRRRGRLEPDARDRRAGRARRVRRSSSSASRSACRASGSRGGSATARHGSSPGRRASSARRRSSGRASRSSGSGTRRSSSSASAGAFLTLATLAGHLTVFIVMYVSVRAVGIPSRRGDDRRGVRGVDARPSARVDPDHAGRRRLRRAGADRGARRLRCVERRGSRGHADLPVLDDRADARLRAAGGGDVEGGQRPQEQTA